MHGETSLTVDTTTGALLVEENEHLAREQYDALVQLLGPAQYLACAAPPCVLTLPPASPSEIGSVPCVRLAGYWHNSLIEGPGRRSTAKLQGCPIHCPGCVTPDSWDTAGGVLTQVDRLAEALLDPAYERDGVTILGGEPFAQPAGLLALVRALRARGCSHILCYSGFTYEALLRRAEGESAIALALADIDMLIDGPYVAALASGAGPWTGSGNQRVLSFPVREAFLELRRRIKGAQPELSAPAPGAATDFPEIPSPIA